MGSVAKFNGRWVQILGVDGSVASVRDASGLGSVFRVEVSDLTDLEPRSELVFVSIFE